jgi:hypothetical protein
MLSFLLTHWIAASSTLGALGLGGGVAAWFLIPGASAFMGPIFKAVGAWLSRRSLAEVVCIIMGLALVCLAVWGNGWKHVAVNRTTQLNECKSGRAADRQAYTQTVQNYRTAQQRAEQEDRAKDERTKAQQAQINQERSNEYEARIADARARAGRLHKESTPPAPVGGTGGSSVPSVSSAASGASQAACDRLSDGSLADPQLCATEQGIQLDELIKWAKAQHSVDPNATTEAPASKAGGGDH